jgi:hypothetical protein
MVSALTDGAHMLYFCTINHGKFSFLFLNGFPVLNAACFRKRGFSASIIMAGGVKVND